MKIARSAWKAVENAADETIAVVTRGPYAGMEIAMDWSQGMIRPETKAARLATIVEDESLVVEHMRLFDAERG